MASTTAAPTKPEASVTIVSEAETPTPSRSTDCEADAEFPPWHEHSVRLGDYFHGPYDVYKHSKWPTFMRLQGSVLPKMIVPLALVGGWATAVSCICQYGHSLAINSVLLTVLGFVVGLCLSFRCSTSYERYSEGRRYWSQLVLTARNLSRLIWIHAGERHDEDPAIGKADLLAKLTALNLIHAFSVALKHRLRFEPSVEYPDIKPLIGHVHTLASDADQAPLYERKRSLWHEAGDYLGLPIAQPNPRRLLKCSKDNLGNVPLEILNYLSAYLESIFANKTLATPVHQAQAMTLLSCLTEVLTGTERVVNTPLPVAYSICISQITWAYVLVLPFQLYKVLGWITIPGTVMAAYIILGIAEIGHEIEDPFGEDVNDLPLDAYCAEIAADMDNLTSRPPPKPEDWVVHAQNKVLYPLSGMEYRAWEGRPVEDIREALAAKVKSREVRKERLRTATTSANLTF